jgi:hypothetical protein
MSSKCAYCADVEGNLEFFKRYVRISQALKWEGAEGTSDLKLNDGYDFVFGGDSVDKGPGDIRCVPKRALSSLCPKLRWARSLKKA